VAATTIDEFLASVPEDQRAALQQLRATIHAAQPGLEEAISYGVPAFKYKGKPFVSMGAAKAHCAFYVQSPAVMDAHAAELAGYDTAKGTVRFKPDDPLPAELVTKLVRARVAESS
jgi:uncharacterized protein YdhG (YjbR/CyaY superfamily)